MSSYIRSFESPSPAEFFVPRRPRSRFYGTFLSVGHSTAPLTTDSDVLLALAFSERVEGFHDGLVKVRPDDGNHSFGRQW